MKLEDMKEIVAPPGSVLILQPRVELSNDQFKMVAEAATLAREVIGLPVLVIPQGMDAYVLQLPEEPNERDITNVVEISPKEDQEELWELYRAGSIVDYRRNENSDWYAAHRINCPISDGEMRIGVELRKHKP